MAFPATMADLTQTVIDLIRLDTTDDTTRVQDALNTSYYETMVENEVLVSSGSAALTAGTATYDLDTVSEIARIKDLWFSNATVANRPPVQVSLDRILRARQYGGATVTDALINWYSLSGQNQLDLFPTPGTAATLHFIYVGFPAALTGSDVPELPEPYASNCLVYGACVPMAEFKADPQLGYYQQQSAIWQQKLRMHLNLRRGMPGGFEYAQDGPFALHDPATITPWWPR